MSAHDGSSRAVLATVRAVLDCQGDGKKAVLEKLCKHFRVAVKGAEGRRVKLVAQAIEHETGRAGHGGESPKSARIGSGRRASVTGTATTLPGVPSATPSDAEEA